MAAHILNAAVVAGILGVLILLVRNLAGRSAGLLAGLVFACSAAIPLEIAWASASQDLLCTFFVVLALHLQVRRKSLLSAVAMAAALLSKETAIAVLPVVVALSVFRPDRSRGDVIRSLAAHGIVALAWAAVHPWTRTALSGSAFAAGQEREYIAFRGASLVPAVIQGVAITLNAPWVMPSSESTHRPEWPVHLVLPGVIAAVIIVLLLTRVKADRDTGQVRGGARLSLLAGSLIFAGSVVLTSLALGRWSPHYACVSALGLSMVAGPALARWSRAVRVVALLAFLWLGIWLRGEPFGPVDPSEPNFGETADALQKVESGFKSLYPALPSSNVYVSVQARGSGGIYRQLFRFQPLRVWYREPNIWVLDPNRRRPNQAGEFLFWIDPNLAVYEIRLTDLAARGPSQQISLPQYQKTLRGYALGLAGAGSVDRAVQILTNMPETSREVWAFDRRTAVALLFAAHRDEDAVALAAGVPEFAAPQAAEAVVALLAEPVSGLDLDQSAMRAFNLDPSHVPSLRLLMHRLEAGGYKLAAGRFASRLLTMLPGDPESAAVLRRVSAERAKEITVPTPYDIPQ